MGPYSSRSRDTRRQFGSTASLIGLTIGLALSGSPADAQQATTGRIAAQQAIAFDIRAQDLNTAILAFADRAGVQVFYEVSRVKGLRSVAVRGNYSREQALAQLLANSDVTYRFSGNTVSLQGPANADVSAPFDDGSTVLNTITVDGENAWGPVEGVVATRSATGTKTDTPIEKIPQTINVVTADEVTARGSVTVSQALRYTPGVNVNGFTDANKIADEVTSRSFAPAPLYLDGAYLPYAGSLGGALQIDPYWLERIEVLKGPSSVLYGQNQPGGIVNLVTKKPLEAPYREVKIGYGSHCQKEVAVDLSGPLNADKSVLYRFTGLAKGGDEQIDFTKSSRVFLAPSVTLKADEDTSVTLYGSYQRDNGVPDYQPLPYIGTVVADPDGKYIDRDLFTGEPGWNDFKREQYVLGADLDHAFSDQVKLRSAYAMSTSRTTIKGFISATSSSIRMERSIIPRPCATS